MVIKIRQTDVSDLLLNSQSEINQHLQAFAVSKIRWIKVRRTGRPSHMRNENIATGRNYKKYRDTRNKDEVELRMKIVRNKKVHGVDAIAIEVTDGEQINKVGGNKGTHPIIKKWSHLNKIDWKAMFKQVNSKCDKLEEEVCAPAAPAAGAATTAAPARFIELDDPPSSAAPAAGGTFQCVTLIGKAKAGGEELTIRGCSPDGTCKLYDALVEAGSQCTPCPEDKCNYGEHISPTAFSLLMFIAIGCIALSHS
ncbi:hypothetical protein HUJ04_000635 [Dendroctonus ponderosae]|nr:hypothetical protein HUJ04_000635 [Dendroctonus ponderosae]